MASSSTRRCPSVRISRVCPLVRRFKSPSVAASFARRSPFSASNFSTLLVSIARSRASSVALRSASTAAASCSLDSILSSRFSILSKSLDSSPLITVECAHGILSPPCCSSSGTKPTPRSANRCIAADSSTKYCPARYAANTGFVGGTPSSLATTTSSLYFNLTSLIAVISRISPSAPRRRLPNIRSYSTTSSSTILVTRGLRGPTGATNNPLFLTASRCSNLSIFMLSIFPVTASYGTFGCRFRGRNVRPPSLRTLLPSSVISIPRSPRCTTRFAANNSAAALVTSLVSKPISRPISSAAATPTCTTCSANLAVVDKSLSAISVTFRVTSYTGRHTLYATSSRWSGYCRLARTTTAPISPSKPVITTPPAPPGRRRSRPVRT